MTEMDGIARRDLERLSAFLDGELSPAEAEQLEARLATDQQLSGTLEALRATSETVGSLPEVRPPRSFTLTQDMVRTRRAYPMLQLGTAMAALGFVLVVGADLLLSSAAGRSVQAPDQALVAADQLAEEQIGDAAPAAAPAAEEAIVEGTERELALTEAESDGDVEDGLAQEFLGSEEEAAASEYAEESAAESETAGRPAEEGGAEPEAGGEAEIAEEGAPEPAAGGYAEFAGESTVEQEAAGGGEQEALKAAADEDPDTGRLAATELDSPAGRVALTVVRMLEIGLAAALIVLVGLTLWVRQRG